MKAQATYELPFPPSVNAMYSNGGMKSRVKSQHYSAWCKEAGLLINRQCSHRFQGPVTVHYVFGKTPGHWDPSNFIKSVEDLLVAHQVIQDDNSKICKAGSWEVSGDFQGVRGTVQKAA